MENHSVGTNSPIKKKAQAGADRKVPFIRFWVDIAQLTSLNSSEKLLLNDILNFPTQRYRKTTKRISSDLALSERTVERIIQRFKKMPFIKTRTLKKDGVENQKIRFIWVELDILNQYIQEELSKKKNVIKFNEEELLAEGYYLDEEDGCEAEALIELNEQEIKPLTFQTLVEKTEDITTCSFEPETDKTINQQAPEVQIQKDLPGVLLTPSTLHKNEIQAKNTQVEGEITEERAFKFYSRIEEAVIPTLEKNLMATKVVSLLKREMQRAIDIRFKDEEQEKMRLHLYRYEVLELRKYYMKKKAA